jgi:hypothetical protein
MTINCVSTYIAYLIIANNCKYASNEIMQWSEILHNIHSINQILKLKIKQNMKLNGTKKNTSIVKPK